MPSKFNLNKNKKIQKKKKKKKKGLRSKLDYNEIFLFLPHQIAKKKFRKSPKTYII